MRIASKVLVPVDFSECSLAALDYAVELATELGASVDLLHVWNPVHTYAMDMALPRVDAFARTEAGHRMQELLERVAEKGITARGQLGSGDPATNIIRVAEQEGIDLIIMGRHGRGRLTHLFLGSVVEPVTRRAPCPVLTIRATAATLKARAGARPEPRETAHQEARP